MDFFEKLSERKENSLALRLANDFPEERKYIGECAERLAELIENEIKGVNSISSLPEEIISSARYFYTLKAEKQVRGFYRLGVKKTW